VQQAQLGRLARKVFKGKLALKVQQALPVRQGKQGLKGLKVFRESQALYLQPHRLHTTQKLRLLVSTQVAQESQSTERWSH
jgi:hypothetical protein